MPSSSTITINGGQTKWRKASTSAPVSHLGFHSTMLTSGSVTDASRSRVDMHQTTATSEEARAWLFSRHDQLRRVKGRGERHRQFFDQAAARYSSRANAAPRALPRFCSNKQD
jgi:hypothetical protein